MRKVSKLVAMVVVILAVIATMAGSVSAYTNADVMKYVNDVHNINGMIFELSNSDKAKIQNYLTANPVDEATANSIMADISAIEAKVATTGATSVNQISVAVKSEIVSMAKSTVAKAGLNLSVNSKAKTFTITTSSGEVLVSTSYAGKAQSTMGAAAGSAGGASASGSTLLYTGANYAVYALPVLAIIAVAIIAKKRA